MNVYDTNVLNEDDALVQVFNHGSSIAHAGFLTTQQIFALSQDESFSIYDFDEFTDPETDASAQPFGDLRQKLECDYVVDIVQSDGRKAVCSGSHKKYHIPISSMRELLGDRSTGLNIATWLR